MEARAAGYDLIVIGGGSAGCAVAARASEDPGRRVLLIEAGPDPRPLPDLVSDPKRQPELLADETLVRHYPVRRPDGSSFLLASGHMLGGGSAVNNMAVARPMACDFTEWERFGGGRWSYDALLPLMRSIEDDEDFEWSPIHGRGGPLHLHRDFHLGDRLDPPGAALIEAATEMGLPPCPDLNGPHPFGICESPYNLIDGRRQSAAAAYLDPARERPNLTIWADALVSRLILDGARVTGVELVDREGQRVLAADHVVLAAGVFHSPQVLMLSGIGPANAIKALGLRVLHRLDGVGANYQDHAVVYVGFPGSAALNPSDRIPKLRFVVRSNARLTDPDLHVIAHAPTQGSVDAPRLSMSVRLLEHRSAGRVTLASSDPQELPLVHAALLEDPADIQAMVDGIGFVDRLTSHPAVAHFYGRMCRPESAAAWRSHVLTTYVSYHHGTGTCRIGPADDPLAVVDERLGVHGVDNLRIADASVLPTIPHANTNLAAILMGEIAARQLTAD